MFKVAYTLPISKQEVRYGEFTNGIWGTLIKFITNDHDISIEEYFDEIITTIATPSRNLLGIDKFCLLLDIRSTYLGNQLELKTESNHSVKISISSIIDKISKSFNQITTTKQLQVGDLIIELAAPRKFFVKDFDELIERSLYRVIDGQNVYYIDDFTSNERETFLTSLPATVVNDINNFVIKLQQQTKDVDIITSNPQLGISELKINLYDLTMLEFLKAIFSDDLMNFYEMQYNLISKLNISYDHFLRMTPSESRIYINLHNRDVKKQEEAMNKDKQAPMHPGGIGGI